jgi:heat shock protein HtpX
MATQRVALGRDLGLQARMLLTLALLGALYAGLVAAVLASGASAVVALAVIAAVTLAQLLLSDRLALAAVGAKVVEVDQAPGLHAIVERLCVQADLPKPRVAVAPAEAPNAFAIGRSQRAAVVCVTSGLLRTLERPELEGVIAHELAHIKNHDVMLMTLASFFASIAAMFAQFGLFFGGGRDRDGHPAMLVVVLVSVVVYLASFVLMLALSRYREFVADRGAALITGRPSALASALTKLSAASQAIPATDLRAGRQLRALFIVSPSIRTLFSTHPPMEARIARLEGLEARLQGRVATLAT